jgi:hypothetical protein
VPPEHLVHSVEPATEYDPAAQVMHDTPSSNFPAAQLEHDADPDGEVLPLPHDVQLVAPIPDWYMPEAQLSHTLAPVPAM